MSVSPKVYFRTPKRIRPEAPLFIFLPGMDGTGQLLRSQTAGLEAAFDIRCLSIPPDDLTSWDELVTQVVDLIRTELRNKPHQTVYLCGESFGGCLAMYVVLRSPQLFQRLILVNPASSFNRRPWIHWGSQITRLLPEVLYQASSVALLPFLASLGRIEASDRQALLDAVQSVTQDTSIWRLSLLRQFDVTEEQLATIDIPTLLVVSGSDRLLPSMTEAEILMSHLSDARMHVLPNSGHACLLEADVNLYEIMKEHQFVDLCDLDRCEAETATVARLP